MSYLGHQRSLARSEEESIERGRRQVSATLNLSSLFLPCQIVAVLLNIHLDLSRGASMTPVQSGDEVATSAAPAATSPRTAATSGMVETALVVAAAASSPSLPTSTGSVTWSKMMAKGQCLLETSSRGIATEINRANAWAAAADARAMTVD